MSKKDSKKDSKKIMRMNIIIASIMAVIAVSTFIFCLFIDLNVWWAGIIAFVCFGAVMVIVFIIDEVVEECLTFGTLIKVIRYLLFKR